LTRISTTASVLPTLLSILMFSAGAEGISETETDLLSRKRALESELQFAREYPSEFYLIIDLQELVVHLKSGGDLLKSSPIPGYYFPSLQHRINPIRTLSSKIHPGTPEPGNDGLRLRGRMLPLDFVGRLIEGPRKATRLYFTPSLLLQSEAVPVDRKVGWIMLSGVDLKAVAAALRPGSVAILINSSHQRNSSVQ